MTKTKVGHYTLREGDTPTSVATVVYNDPKKAPLLSPDNQGEWYAGRVVKVPNKRGTLVTVQEGEQFSKLHARSGLSSVSEQAKDEFFKWNGGPERSLQPGDEVFFVDLRTNYGY